MTDIQKLIARAEECHQRIALEYFNHFSGQQDQLNVVSILEEYPELYARETLDGISAAQPAGDTDERLLRFLRADFSGNYVQDQVKGMLEELANAEGSATVSLEGESWPYRAMPVIIANESDYERRGRLEQAYLAVMDGLNPLRRRIFSRLRETMQDIGYENQIAYSEQLMGMRIRPLAEQMRRFLDETDEIFEQRLRHYASIAGLGDRELRSCDLGYILRARQYDGMFASDDMVPALARTLRGMGIDLDSQKNVLIDLEDRPRKSPRAFCVSIRAPQDVRIVLKPHGGQDDFSTLFHEAGHMQFSAHMDPELSVVYRHSGDTSVHESYAFLLQHLVSNPVWWKEIMREDPGDYPAFARFHRLYFLRRYGAKLLYEIEFHEQGGGEELAERYVHHLTRSNVVSYPRERYLADFDRNFYVLQYLQAWIWEVQLRRHLEAEFGENWFSSRRAGDFLRGLWSEGQKYDVWEIAQKLGYAGLDISLIQQEITA
ncbi:hypothetical protein KDL44_06545 [bacterium]|nr:hypothetical protein [bacterium]